MFRKAVSEDCLSVYHLICDLEKQELPFDIFQSIYTEQLESRSHSILVCELDETVAGVLHMRFERQLHHCDTIAEIMEFAIDPAFRSQGIGKAMLEYACDVAKEAGCSQIELATNQLRKDAHRFYAREGLRNFHYKSSKSLTSETTDVNRLGR